MYFPAGTYRITEAVFSYQPVPGALYGPIRFAGDGWRTSVLLFDPPSSTETWFYNASGPAYYFDNFEDLGFGSTNEDVCSGFRIATGPTGHDTSFSFTPCFFGMRNGLRRGFFIEGAVTSDLFTFTHCIFVSHTKEVFTLKNQQSVGHKFLGCDFALNKSDIFKVEPGTVPQAGGGDINVFGGSFVLGVPGASPPLPPKGWLINMQASGGLNHVFNFYGIRTEHFPNSGLVQKTEGGAGSARVTFHGSTFARNFPAAHEAVSIGIGCKVCFRDSVLDQSLRYRILNTGQNENSADPGSILFESCLVTPDLSACVTLDSGYAIARATGCSIALPLHPIALSAASTSIGAISTLLRLRARPCVRPR